MIKVSVLYANRDGATFDMGYYCSVGIGSLQRPPAYVAIGHLWFDSMDACQAALDAHGAEIMADIPKYTNIEPVIQISEVRISDARVASVAGR